MRSCRIPIINGRMWRECALQRQPLFEVPVISIIPFWIHIPGMYVCIHRFVCIRVYMKLNAFIAVCHTGAQRAQHPLLEECTFHHARDPHAGLRYIAQLRGWGALGTNMLGPSCLWVAVKEYSLDYHIMDVCRMTRFLNYGILI